MEIAVILYVAIPSNTVMTELPSKTSDAPTRTPQPTLDALTLDVLFDMLADQRRRVVLYCLCKYQTPMALADLADEVATREQEMPIPDIPAEEVKQVYLSLYHSHIPKLVETNVVEYTQERDLVALAENSEQVEPILKRVMENG